MQQMRTYSRRRLSRAGNDFAGGVVPVPPSDEQQLPPLRSKPSVNMRKQPDVSPYRRNNGLANSRQNSPLRQSSGALSKENRPSLNYLSSSPDSIHLSPPCNAYRSRARPFGYVNYPPVVKVDMKRGSFSYKQKVGANQSSYGEQSVCGVEKCASRPVVTEPDMRCDSKTSCNRTSSPGLTARSLRFQQMSKRYLLDKSSLQKSVSLLSKRSQSSARKAAPDKSSRSRMWTPEPLPSVSFVAELECITKISDFPECLE